MVLNIDPLGLIEEALGERKEGVQMLAVAEIRANPVQPSNLRRRSPRRTGELHPPTRSAAALGRAARPRRSGFVLLCGERRWRASQLAGLREVPVVVHAPVDEATAACSPSSRTSSAKTSTTSNAPEAIRLKQHSRCRAGPRKRLGMSERPGHATAALVRLGEPIQAMIGEGRLTARHGRSRQAEGPRYPGRAAEQAAPLSGPPSSSCARSPRSAEGTAGTAGQSAEDAGGKGEDDRHRSAEGSRGCGASDA